MNEATAAGNASAHYDEDYFVWQQSSGQFGGWANHSIYKNTVRASDTVLDFGCGGGFLVSGLGANKAYGIEPNSTARKTAASNGVEVFETPRAALAALGEESIDVIISNNALEHSFEPWHELKALLPLIRKGGTLHFVVPCENISWLYRPDDVNMHVYSWSPQSFGNLLKSAGFEVIFSRPFIHKWPPAPIARQIARFGRGPFNVAARIWGRFDRRWFQVEAVARRPA